MSTQELKLAELIINSSPAVLFRRLADVDPKKRKMVYVSPNISHFGYKARDFLDGTIMFRDIIYPEDSPRTLKEIDCFVEQDNENYTQVYRIITKAGEIRWVEDRTSIFIDEETDIKYHQGIVVDIHERMIAEEKLRQSEEKYRRIVETTGEGFLLMNRSLKIVDLNSAYSKMVGIPRSKLIGQYPFPRYSHEFNQLLSFEQTDSICQQDLEIECEVKTADQRMLPVLIQANGLCSDTGDISGVMAFVTDLTSQKQALSLAGEVQRSLLPNQAPSVPGLDIAGQNIPCDEVGGDYFDFLQKNENNGNRLSIVIGDISGHGVASALLMSSARAFLRMRASQTDKMADVIKDMNQHMTKDVYASGTFMTLFYLALENTGSDIEWVRAGHDPAILYDPELNRFEELKGPGIALGVDEKFEYQVQRKKGLTPGQIIVLGTDGIWEGSNGSGEMFGKRRVKDIIRRNASNSAEKILTSIFDAHRRFTQGIKPKDDITGVVVKIVDNYQNFVI